jgi:outer membrane immunogenic protein
VVGFETDINYSGVNLVSNGLAPIPTGGAFVRTVSQTLPWFGTVRGRVGFLVSQPWLIYATGGLAYGRVKSSSITDFPPPGSPDDFIGSASELRLGWTAGAGFEYAIGTGWSVKAEYLYVDLGSINYTDICVESTCGQPPSFQTTVATREHIGRIGINYQFH